MEINIIYDETKYSSMHQDRMWKTAFKKLEVDHTTSNFLKAVFHKLYFVHS